MADRRDVAMIRAVHQYRKAVEVRVKEQLLHKIEEVIDG